MRARWTIGVVALLVFVGGFLLFKWKRDEPRRDCIRSLQGLCQNLTSNSAGSLLDEIVLPQTLRARTVPEQLEFLRKALQDEISPEGIAALKAHGAFGPLVELFPDEAQGWVSQAQANPNDCLAFKMERGGIRAEVVLLREGQTFRVVRCNNVKQMAEKGKRS